MTDVVMPQMGESIAEGTLTKWLKKVGDRVERDEPLFEITTDKVDAEIPSPAAGVLQEVRVEAGSTVEVNTVVAVIGAGDSVETSKPAGAATPAEAAPPAAAASPAPPEASPPLAPPRPAPAPQRSTAAPPAAPGPAPPPQEKPRAEMTTEELRLSRSSPVVRRIAAEHQVDIRQVPGTGIGGRVTKQDILTHIQTQPAAAPAPAAPATPTAAAAPPRDQVPPPATPPPVAPAPIAPAPAAPAAASAAAGASQRPAERVEVVPMSAIRRKTAEHMLLSKRTSAHVTTVFEVDMTRVDGLRRKHKPTYEQRDGVRLTYMPFILKAVVDALKAFPVLNASVDGESIVYKKDINLGVAVALEWGLIVPVIRNADERNVLGLARGVNDLAQRARSKQLKIEEVQGGTFTITNPGIFGGLFGTPIISQPQVAILGVGTIEKRPVVRDDAIAIRTMCCLALSFDHRIVDGADADQFMAHIKRGLQEFDESAL